MTVERIKGMQDRKLEVRSAPLIDKHTPDRELTKRFKASQADSDEQIELMRLYIKEHGRKK